MKTNREWLVCADAGNLVHRLERHGRAHNVHHPGVSQIAAANSTDAARTFFGANQYQEFMGNTCADVFVVELADGAQIERHRVREMKRFEVQFMGLHDG